MEIYGRQYDFLLTVGAACEIAEHCPGGELKAFQQLIQGPMAAAMEGRSVFICALSRGAEETRAYTEPGYEPAPLTPTLLRTLPIETFNAALAEASQAFLAGLQTAVGVEPAKKNADGEAEASS